jgi:hypothetical protein
MKWVKQTMYNKNGSILQIKRVGNLKTLCMSHTDTFAVLTTTPLMSLDYQEGVAGVYMG